MVVTLPAGDDRVDASQPDDSSSQYLFAETSPDPVMFLDRRWNLIFANQHARRLAGLDQASRTQCTYWDLFPEVRGLPIAHLLRSVMDSRAPGHMEYNDTRAGTWMDVQAFPFQDGLAVYYRDITARKVAEQLRQKTSQEIQEFFDATPDFVLGIAPDWMITFCNKAARARSTPEEIVGEDLFTRYPASSKEPFASHYRRSMQERVQTEFESFVSAPYNIWLKIVARPFAEGILVLYTDITALKNAEAALHALSRELHQVLEVTTDAVVSLNRQWMITFVNRRARQMLGRDDLVGKHLWGEFPAAVDGDIYRRYHETMEQRTPCDFEEFYPAPLNMWISIQCRPSDDGIVVFSHDVTNEYLGRRKLLEQQEKLAFVQHAARVATWVVDHAEGSMTFSEGSFPVFGCPNHNIRSKRDLAPRLHPDDSERLFNTFDAVEDGDLAVVEYRVFADDGTVLWLEGRGSTLYDQHLGRRLLRGMTTDVTARKNAEALRDAASRELQQVLDATSDCVVSFDRDYNYTFLNRQAESLLGRYDLLGKNVFEEFPSTAADAVLRRTMEERVACELEIFNPAPLNRWLSIQTRPAPEGIVVFFRDITEERARKQSLLEQQETLAFLQDTARIATWTVDLDTGAMKISDGSAPIYGRPNHEITTVADFYQFMHPEDLKTMLARHQRSTLEASRGNSQDYRILARDGSIHWLEGRAVTVHDAAGRATHLRGMTMDITVRKHNEEELAASEARYRVLVDLNPQTLWIGAPDGSITYVNQGHLDYRGVTAEVLRGDGWLSGIYPGDQQPTVEAWTHSVATGDEYSVEARIRSRHGEFRWWTLRALPVRDEAGTILTWLGTAYDIHDARMATETLRQKHEETERHRAEVEAIYETAPIGLALFDPVDFRWLRLNDCQAEIFDMRKNQLLGTRLFDTVNIPGVRELFETVASGTPVLDQLVEGELPSRPGETRTWMVNYRPIFAPDGSVQAITAASLEITQQKKAEAALVQSEKLAAVGRLASSISHEINNPLEAITNILYIVASDPELPASALEYVTMAQSELARVSQIATQTLRFHRQAVHRTDVTAADLVNAVLNLYHGRLSNSGITVEISYSSSTPILCFENDIRQVLNNLISNAIDAMRGGGRLVARAHNATRTNPAGESVPGVRITIADTGHGMPPTTRARVFEPFYTTKELNGTGLGLWISTGIVDRHHGSLTLRSSQHPTHHGTVFSLFLPV